MDNPEGRKASYSSIPYFHMWFPSWFTNQSIFQNSDRYHIYFTFLDNVLYIHWSSDTMWFEKNVHLTSIVFSLKISSLNAVVCLFGLTTDWTKAGKCWCLMLPKYCYCFWTIKRWKMLKKALMFPWQIIIFCIFLASFHWFESPAEHWTTGVRINHPALFLAEVVLNATIGTVRGARESAQLTQLSSAQALLQRTSFAFWQLCWEALNCLHLQPQGICCPFVASEDS